jgi:hypothetical protein
MRFSVLTVTDRGVCCLYTYGRIVMAKAKWTNTPQRSIRIPDDVWEKAKATAEEWDTSVTVLIVAFLQSFRKGVRPKYGVEKPAPVRPDPIDPAECRHPKSHVKKMAALGTFCGLCGTRLQKPAGIL